MPTVMVFPFVIVIRGFSEQIVSAEHGSTLQVDPLLVPSKCTFTENVTGSFSGKNVNLNSGSSGRDSPKNCKKKICADYCTGVQLKSVHKIQL